MVFIPTFFDNIIFIVSTFTMIDLFVLAITMDLCHYSSTHPSFL